jgi:photosystem II stability/assembly factor-like uncharacterized protein
MVSIGTLKQKLPVLIALLAISLTAASCIPFTTSRSAGVLKTTNGGTDWQPANAIKDNTAALASTSVSVIRFDPKNDQRLFMASYDDGLYKSDNSGESWEKILSKIAVYDFAISPDNSDVIYVAGFFANHGKALITKDGGKSWVEIFNEASAQNAVRAIAVNPANPQDIIIGMSSGNVIKSVDGGSNWRVTVNFEDRINRIIYVGPNVYVLVRSKGVFKSADNGERFANLTQTLTPASGGDVFYSDSLPVGSYSQLAVSQNNPGLMYITSESGLYKTVDEGKQWIRVPVPVKNDEVAFKAVAFSPTDDRVMYTSAGNTIYKSSDGAQTFQTISVPGTGFVNYILPNPSQPQIVYAGIFAQ